MKFIKEAQTWRSILGTQTFFWPLTPPPPRYTINQPLSKGLTPRLPIAASHCIPSFGRVYLAYPNFQECVSACVGNALQSVFPSEGTGGATPRFWTPTTPPTNCWLEAPWGGGGEGQG